MDNGKDFNNAKFFLLLHELMRASLITFVSICNNFYCCNDL